MKKLLFMLSVLGVLMIGCNDDGFEDDTNPSRHSYNNPSGLPEPAANEIYYTTTDGFFIDFGDKEFYTMAVASHTAKNDSIFVLKFTRNLGEIESLINLNFEDLKTLKSIRLPEGLISIGDNAFDGCFSLARVTIPNSVTTIGYDAFCQCDSLRCINIPKSIAKIGSHAFYCCSLLSKVYITDLGNWCKINFYKGNSNPLNGAALYLNGKEIKNLVIPSSDSLTKIAPYAFRRCESVNSIAMHNNITEIGYSAFEGCDNLMQINIGNNVNIIGSESFRGCESLTTVTIPENVTSIGYEAFSGCDSVATIYCKATIPPRGGGGMFNYNAPGRKIYVPRESVDAYKVAGYWSDYADDIVGYDF